MTHSVALSTFKFLKTLKENNNREWFNNNKEQYLAEHVKMIELADSLLSELRKHDNIETVDGKKSLYRIYRDTRFSKDKTPYKNYWSGSFKRATRQLRGGYYFHIEEGQSYIAGGFFSPNSEDLARIRVGIDHQLEEFTTITNSTSFKKDFGNITGDSVKTSPKGYSKEHPGIEFLRLKQFVLSKPFSDEEVMRKDFVENVIESYKNMHPFFNLMSDILTTDANGTPLH